jgi:phosphate starvation-inducible protein PhoH and related proteins
MGRRFHQDQEEVPVRAPKRVKQKMDCITLSRVHPKTEGQVVMMQAFNEGYDIVATGSAGTGKSYIAAYLALEKLISKEVENIIIVRSAVNIRNQGFLPGSLEEKELVYTIPYKCIVDKLCNSGTAWESLTKKGFIKFLSTTYVRGLTLENCIVIVDEIQNMDAGEIESILTRVGENCQFILCGDTRQNDLKRKREESGFNWLLELIEELEEYFTSIVFTKDDIVRSEKCKAIITAIERIG